MCQVLLVATVLVLCSDPVSGKGAEQLDRGVVVLRAADGSCYVGWRLLESDPAANEPPPLPGAPCSSPPAARDGAAGPGSNTV